MSVVRFLFRLAVAVLATWARELWLGPQIPPIK